MKHKALPKLFISLLTILCLTSTIISRPSSILRSNHLRMFLRLLQEKDNSPKSVKNCEKPLGKYFLAEEPIQVDTPITTIQGFKDMGLVTLNSVTYSLNHLSVFIPKNPDANAMFPLRVRIRGVANDHQAIFEFNFDDILGDKYPNSENKSILEEMLPLQKGIA